MKVPTAGSVKIPVRDTEVAVSDYDKANGIAAGTGGTSYETMVIDKDKAVNEIIDGFDAEAVPDNLVADRLDSRVLHHRLMARYYLPATKVNNPIKITFENC